MGFIKKMLDGNKRELKTLTKIAEQVESFAEEIASLTDEDLKNRTLKFQADLKEI